MKRTWLLLLCALTALPSAAQSAPIPLQWALNPGSPCAEDSVALVFRGYWPIWDQDSSSNPFFVMARDSFARAVAVSPTRAVVRTVYRPDRFGSAQGFFGVPVGIGRLPVGPHGLIIEHHQIVQMLDGSLDSTVVETPLSFDVSASCDAPVVPMGQFPFTSSATLTPVNPCPWTPMTLTFRGQFSNSCGRVLLAAADDSVHGRLVTRLLPNFRNPGCFDFAPPWSATIPLGLPAPGLNHIEVAFLQQGFNYRWPPTPPVRRTGVMDVVVAGTCGDLPSRAPLPWVTGIGAFDAGGCEGMQAPGTGIPLAIRGVFPNGCRHVQTVDLLPNPLGGSGLPPLVRLTVQDDACDGISCVEGEAPWCVETRLPSLPIGRYALMVQVVGAGCDELPGTGTTMDAYTLDVPRSPASASGDGTVGVEPPASAGASFTLSPPVPNPSSGSVSFRLTLGAPGPLDVAVYDLSGRLIRSLHRGIAEAGARALIWDGRDAQGQPARTGVYFLRAISPDRTEWRRIVRLRARTS